MEYCYMKTMGSFDVPTLIIATFKYYLPKRSLAAKSFAEQLKDEWKNVDPWIQDVICKYYIEALDKPVYIGHENWWKFIK